MLLLRTLKIDGVIELIRLCFISYEKNTTLIVPWTFQLITHFGR